MRKMQIPLQTNTSGLSLTIKRLSLTGKKKLCVAYNVQYKDLDSLKSKGLKIRQAVAKENKAYIVILSKINLKIKSIIRKEQGHCIIIKNSVNQEVITKYICK